MDNNQNISNNEGVFNQTPSIQNPVQPQQPVQQPMYNQQPVNNIPPQQPAYNNTPNEPKKGGKKGLLIILAIVMVALIGFGVYYFMNKDDKQIANEQNNNSNQNVSQNENGNGDNYVLITVGQVDHGKSTLVSAISKQYGKYITADELSRASEIKNNNVTFNVSSIDFKSDDRSYLLFDMPGHSDIVKSLLSGGVKPDGAIMVISATDGPMPQTRAHLLLLDTLGIKNLVVYLNKCDMVDDEELLNLVEDEVRVLLSDYGFDGDNVPIIKGSALKAVEGDSKYKGSITSLIKELDKFSLPNSEKEINATKVESNVYFLTKEEGGMTIALMEDEKYDLQISINNSDVNVELGFIPGVSMIMPGDDVSVNLSFAKSLSVKKGDYFQLKQDGKIIGVGVISNISN